MIDFFVSYAREDRRRVEVMVAALEARGWTVWWDREIGPLGSRFRDEIRKALDEARCILVVWSAASVNKDWVLGEADVGRARGTLCPVLLDEVEIPIEFRQWQTTDLKTWDGDPAAAAWVDFSDKLADALTRGPKAPRRPTVQRRWFAPSAGAAALIAVAALISFDVTGRLFESFGDLTRSLGLELPPVAFQIFLFAAAAACLWIVRGGLWPPERWTARSFAAAVPAGVVVTAITAHWIDGAVRPFPDHVQGLVHTVTPDDLYDLHVAVLARSGEVVSMGSGSVDTETGAFSVQYRKEAGDRPRAVRLSKAGCADVMQSIPRTRLRAGTDVDLTFNCKEVR